jgi:hypothetical protein
MISLCYNKKTWVDSCIGFSLVRRQWTVFGKEVAFCIDSFDKSAFIC